ncbi:MAG: phosphotransferase [Acidobacteria bacterium]|nr:phosphotransferase [Acidobacteriota bacterium]
MSSRSALFEGRLDAGRRFGLGAGRLTCERMWPFGQAQWTALLTEGQLEPDTSWAVLEPAAEWPAALRRLFRRGRARWLLDAGLAAWRLEHDPIIDGVDDVLDPRAVGLAPSLERGRLLGFKPLRRAVTCFDASANQPAFYVKHLRPGRAEAQARHHDTLASWTVSHAGFRIPSLVDVRNKPDFMVWERARGVSLRKVLLSRDGQRGAAAAGSCLASLHVCPLQPLAARTRESELATAEKWLSLAAPLHPRSQDLLEVSSALAGSSRNMGRAQPALAHGDFHDGQLLLDEEHTTLLDIDTLVLAEPELDAGNLLAHFDLLRVAHPELTRTDFEPAFLEAYARGRGPLLDAPRLAWYRACAVLRLSCVHAARHSTHHLAGSLANWAQHLASRWAERKEIVS